MTRPNFAVQTMARLVLVVVGNSGNYATRRGGGARWGWRKKKRFTKLEKSQMLLYGLYLKILLVND